MSQPGIEPFAVWLLSLVGEELPLSVEKQSLLVSLLGVYAIFSFLIILLLLLFGVSCGEFCSCFACCPPFWSCCQSDIESFVILDEKTDIDHLAFKALAKAELVDGTPRLHAGAGRRAAGNPLGGSGWTGDYGTPRRDGRDSSGFFSPSPADPNVFVDAPAARSPLSGRQLPNAQVTVPVVPSHLRTADMQNRYGLENNCLREGSSHPPYTPMHSDQLVEMQKQEAKSGRTPQSHRANGKASPGFESTGPDDPRRQIMPQSTGSPPSRFAPRSRSPDVASVKGERSRPGTPSSRTGSARSTSWEDTIGWRDKDSPAWYGV